MHLQSVDASRSHITTDAAAAGTSSRGVEVVSRERLQESPLCHQVEGGRNKEQQPQQQQEEVKEQSSKVNYCPLLVNDTRDTDGIIVAEQAIDDSLNQTSQSEQVKKKSSKLSGEIILINQRGINFNKLNLIVPNNRLDLTEENRSASVPCLINVDEHTLHDTSDNKYFISVKSSVNNKSQRFQTTTDEKMNGIKKQLENNLKETDALLSHNHHHHHHQHDRVTIDSPLLPPVRRAMSLSSSYPDPVEICRMRRLYCPRQPPTILRRTLSISRTNLTGKKKKKLTLYQKNLLICLSMVSFTSFLCMSIMAPFFPLEASTKGMSGTISGLVFSCYALVVMLSSPLLGHILPAVGAKFMLISGIFAAGVTNILFGMLNHIQSSVNFTIYCFLVRSCEALSAAAFSTASYTYIMYSFPDDIGTAFGLTETCVGLGMSLGPAIGSALYAIGGYGTPFYVLGTLILLNLPVCWYLVKPIETLKRPNDSDIKETTASKQNESVGVIKNGYWSLITIPEVAVVCTVVVTVSQSQGFLDPTLEPHFRQYNISAEFVGLAFLLMSASYAILSPFIGKITSKFNNRYPLMIAGLIISFIGLILLGPSPFIPFNPNLWISSASMILIGFGYAIAFIPTFECILLLAIKKGFQDNVKTYSLVSGLWSCMYSLGEVIGPTIGGLFVDKFDFRIGSTIIAIISLLTALLTTITNLIKCHPSCSSNASTATFADSSDDDEESYEETTGAGKRNNLTDQYFSRQSNLFPTCQSLLGTAGTIDSGIGEVNPLTLQAASSAALHRTCPFDLDEHAPNLKKAHAGGSVSYLSPSYGTSASAFREFGNSV